MIMFATPTVKIDSRRTTLAVSCSWTLDCLQTSYPEAVEGRIKTLLNVYQVDSRYHGACFKERVLQLVVMVSMSAISVH